MSQNERQLVQGALGRSPDGTAPAKLSSSMPRPMPAACQCTPRCLMGHLYWKSGSAAMADAASLRRKPDLRSHRDPRCDIDPRLGYRWPPPPGCRRARAPQRRTES